MAHFGTDELRDYLNTPLQMFLMMLAGWVNEPHRAVNAYLKEED